MRAMHHSSKRLLDDSDGRGNFVAEYGQIFRDQRLGRAGNLDGAIDCIAHTVATETLEIAVEDISLPEEIRCFIAAETRKAFHLESDEDEGRARRQGSHHSIEILYATLRFLAERAMKQSLDGKPS